MRIIDLTETPRLIDDNDFEPSINDFDVDDTNDNHELYHKIHGSKKTSHVEYINGDSNCDLKLYGDKYVLLSHDSETIDYYVKVEEGSFKLLGKWLCQVEVWRNGMSPYKEIAYYVINKHLMSKYGTIVSDSLQTSRGKGMWLRIGSQAIIDGLYVYAYDKSANRLDKFKDGLYYRERMNNYYGKTVRYENIRLVISSKELV